MNPRLKTSKKWTEFPKEYLTQIQDVFQETFKKHLEHAKLIVEGRIYTEEILLRVGVLEKGRLAQINFEVSMNYSTKTKDAVDRIHDAIDAVASLMNDYFASNGEIEFPLTWQEFEFNKRSLYIQFTTVNSTLEAEADALLGKSFEEMVQEDKETEDALSRAEEKLDTKAEPTMFGGGAKKKATKKSLH
jgi:hypothetical protein